MGIKDFNAFFKDICSPAFKSENISFLKGKRVAVDGTWMMFKILSIKLKEIIISLDDPINGEIPKAIIINKLFEGLINTEKLLFYNQIESFWIFDGTCEIDKQATKEKRVKSKIQSKNKFDEMKKMFNEMDPLDSKREDLRVKLIDKRSKSIYTDKSISEAVIQKMIDFGVSVTIAPSEGELHAASLCYSGHADFVYSVDTDVLAIGANLITQLTRNVIEYIDIDVLLNGLRFDQKQLRDCCILFGCDFNEKLFRVNQFDIFCSISDNKNIENIEKAKKQETLNYLRCRSLLSPYETDKPSSSTYSFEDIELS